MIFFRDVLEMFNELLTIYMLHEARSNNVSKNVLADVCESCAVNFADKNCTNL